MRGKKKENNEEGLRNWKERRIKIYQLQGRSEGMNIDK